jgi:GDPmannose 4,6-dehydratase
VVGTGALRILETMRQLKLNKSKYLQASSSEMFGNSNELPQNENTKFNPQSPYATAKVLAYWTTKNYRDNHKIFASNSIMFNHESPRRGINFVTKKIIRGLCKIKYGRQDLLELGNLDAMRDWGYAKEYCEVFWKILQHNKPDDFVIATNRSHSVRKFVELSCKELNINLEWSGKGVNEIGINKKNKKIVIKLNKKYFRRGEVDHLKGDFSKSQKLLKWKPKTNLEQLVKIMVKEEIKNIKSNKFY